ncbi:MAG: hypothetical protein ISR65_02070 [Bacteriovoracaceae bacterium]|nr:hypothetical protein [Bacteriovoracaceae bacterium]
MAQIVTGLFLIAFGLWGVFDAWHYMVDALKGGSGIVMAIVGVLSLALATKSSEKFVIGRDE